MNRSSNQHQESDVMLSPRLWRMTTAVGILFVLAGTILSIAWGQERKTTPPVITRDVTPATRNPLIPGRSTIVTDEGLRQEIRRAIKHPQPVASNFAVIYSHETWPQPGGQSGRINQLGGGVTVSSTQPFEKDFSIDVPEDETQLQKGEAYILLNVRNSRRGEPANNFDVRLNDGHVGRLGLDVGLYPNCQWESHIIVVDPKHMKKGRNKLTLFVDAGNESRPRERSFEIKSVIFHYHVSRWQQ